MLHAVWIGFMHSASRITLHTSFGRLEEEDAPVSPNKRENAFKGCRIFANLTNCKIIHLPWQVTVISKTFLSISGVAITALSICMISTFSMPSGDKDKEWRITDSHPNCLCHILMNVLLMKLTKHFDAGAEGAVTIYDAVVIGGFIVSIPLSYFDHCSSACQCHCLLCTWWD